MRYAHCLPDRHSDPLPDAVADHAAFAHAHTYALAADAIADAFAHALAHATADAIADAFAYTCTHALAHATAHAIADATAISNANDFANCAWIPPGLRLPARILPNSRGVLQRRPKVCAMQRGWLALPTRLSNAVWSAVPEQQRERLSGRFRMPTRFPGGKCEHRRVCRRLLLSCREH